LNRFFLKIFDYLKGRMWLAIALSFAIAAACIALSTRLDYEEDITQFLPSDEVSARYSEAYNALGSKNNIILVFSPKDSTADEYAIEDAMDAFGLAFDALDSTGLVTDRQICTDGGAVLDMMESVSADFPLYMTDADYARVDSLLGIPGYVARQLEADRQTLQFPSGDMAVSSIQSDPLRLFSPVLQRLASTASSSSYEVVDGYIFTEEGSGVAFLTSPYGTSESGMNSKVCALVDETIAEVEAEHPEVHVSAVGSPIIAVGNATQIKKDSILAIAVALLLIGLLLVLSFRRFSDIAWIAVSIVFGWLFALGAMSLIRDSMSIIVIGVASVIIGIAVNYPLHFMDGLKSGVSPRQNLAEMVEPLLIGNITTIAAFLCLVWLKARAMQDLGLFGSLMLAGTIVFVLVFLPVFTKARKKDSRTTEFGNLLPEKVPTSPWLFLAVMLVTVVMYFLSKGTEFDSNMNHINYMTEEQRSNLEMLQAGTGEEGYQQIYAIAEGATLEEALSNNDRLLERMEAMGDSIAFVKGAGNFLPSMERRQERIDRWNEFWKDGRKEALLAELGSESSKAGFSQSAFAPFVELMERDFVAETLDAGSPIASAYDGTYILSEEGKYAIVNQVYHDGTIPAEELKASLRSGNELVFDTSDISSQLVKVLSSSFDYIGLVCSLVVFIFLCLSFRRLEVSLLTFLPLAVSWFWILGIMSLLDIRFNIVNIILATFIFGQGDDYTIFMTEGLIYEYAYGKKRLATYKNSVFNSAVIMFIGIGALVLAKHPAMKSLGEVTVIGMFIVVVMAYYLPPVIFRWLTEKKGAKRDVPITLKRLGYSIFALVAFLLIMFFFVYPYTFFHFLGKNTPEKRLSYHRFLQKMGRFLVNHVPGVGFRSENPYGEDFSKPAVIIANHQSHLDIMCLMMLTPKLVFFTNEWVWKNPIYGYVLRKAEYYPVADGLEHNIERVQGLVGRGYSLVIFPEGTRTLDGSIGRFHRGAFFAASKLGLDILPVYLHGLDHMLPKRDFMLREGEMFVEVGQRQKASDDYRTAAKEYRRLFQEHMEELRKRLETPEYLATYVRYKYFYKGPGVEAESRRKLAKVSEIGWLHDKTNRERMDIHDCGQGEYSFIYALMHPETEVHAYDSDEGNIQIASNCSGIPENLHYHLEAK